MESITDVLTNGLKSIKNNKILFVPPIILMAILMVIAFGIIALSFSPTFLQSLGNIWITFFAYLCLFILIFTISVFINTGQIGMAKEAASTGKTNMSHFMSYGKRFFGRVFAANIILILIQAIALIFWTPAVYFLYKYDILYNFTDAYYSLINSNIPSFATSLGNIFSSFSIFSISISIIIGAILSFIYIVVLSVLFFFVKYNIVVDDISAIASFKKSVSLLKAKTSQVILFIVFLFIVLFTISMIFNFIVYMILTVLSLVLLFLMVLSPTLAVIGYILYMILSIIFNIIYSTLLPTLSVVWVTRFYMAITEKQLYVIEKITN